MEVPCLLDTTVLLHIIRNNERAKVIDEQFQLSDMRLKPLICEVSIGELMAFALNLNWGQDKKRRLKDLIERNTVIVRISDPGVFDEYAQLSTLAKSSGWSMFHGKNDLWVAAAARASSSHLITMDRDFLPLCARPGWQVTVLDEVTARPILAM
jgi:predicted nucleic acid-binding protein